MEPSLFKTYRNRLSKTQEKMAQLLGLSVKAVRSYEQGWRAIPVYVERQMMFLVSRKEATLNPPRPCWEVMNCPEKRRKICPAWELNTGDLCWFINGTICGAVVHKNWKDKIEICKKCRAFPAILHTVPPPAGAMEAGASCKDLI